MLNGKRKLFADFLVTGSNSLEAVIAAGYDPATAMLAAAKLEKDEEILSYVVSKQKSIKTKHEKVVPKSEEEIEQENAEKFAIGKTSFKDPKKFLEAQMNNPNLEDRLRFDAAKTLLPLYHGKIGEIGKKRAKEDAADKISKGKFGTAAAPNLKIVKQ